MKITEQQQLLLDALKAGADVMFHPYMGRFNPQEHYSVWYGNDYQGPKFPRRRCTREAKALLKAGLVKKIKQDFRGHWLAVV